MHIYNEIFINNNFYWLQSRFQSFHNFYAIPPKTTDFPHHIHRSLTLIGLTNTSNCIQHTQWLGTPPECILRPAVCSRRVRHSGLARALQQTLRSPSSFRSLFWIFEAFPLSGLSFFRRPSTNKDRSSVCQFQRWFSTAD